MGKSKVPKPAAGMTDKQVKQQQKTLNKLQNQLARNARQNTKSINQLITSQQVAQDANVEQVNLLQQAAVAQAAAPVENTSQLALEASLRQQAETVANAQSDNVTSAATNALRDKQKADAYARFNLVKAALRNQQIY